MYFYVKRLSNLHSRYSELQLCGINGCIEFRLDEVRRCDNRFHSFVSF
jgi:hypothetical protein